MLPREPSHAREKILLSHCDADDVKPGDVVMARCDVVMANDVSGPVAFRQLEKMGAGGVRPSQDRDGRRPFHAGEGRPLGPAPKNPKEWADTHGVAF